MSFPISKNTAQHLGWYHAARRFLCACFALVSVIFANTAIVPDAVWAQDLEVRVTAEDERTHARLRFEFPGRLTLPEYEIDTENGILLIFFDEGVDIDVRDVSRTLSSYITIARRDPDGRALRFALARAVRINTMEAGENLFIDFLPPTWQGFPPPLPDEVIAELAARAEQAAREAAEAERRRLLGEIEPEVSLRVGQAPTFTRYAFDWNVPFNTEVTQAGSELSVSFDFDVPIDLSPAQIDQADELLSISAEQDGASLTVDLEVEPGVGLRWFDDGNSFIVDIDRTTDLERAPGEPTAIEEALEQIGAAPLNLTQPEGTSRFSAVGERTEEPITPVVTAPVVEATQDLQATQPVASITAPPTEESDSALLNPAEQESQVDRSVETDVGRDVVATSEPSSGTREATPVVGTAPNAFAPEIAPQLADGERLALARIQVTIDGDVARLSFPFVDPTPAAAFRRASTVTLLFETDVEFDLRSLRLELGDLVRGIETSQNGGLKLVHLLLRRDSLMSLEPSGNRWLVLLGPSVAQPVEPLEISRGTFPDGRAHADVTAEGFGRIQEIVHPVVGDTLSVVPMLGPPRGSLAGQDFAQFEVLPSAHGLVVRAKDDAVSVEREDNRVLIARERGLALSEAGLSLGSFGFSASNRVGYFDVRDYLGNGPSEFDERYDAFQDQLSEIEGVVLTERLLEFARFLIAFELGQEAIGALLVAADEDASLEQDRSYLTLKTAALAIAGRFDEAIDISSSQVVDALPDAAMWGLLAHAGNLDWAEVNAVYDDVAPILTDYPPRLSSKIRMSGVEAALGLQAVDLALERLSQIEPSLVPPRSQSRFELLQARTELERGQVDSALQAFDRLRDQVEGPIGAQATLLGVDARLVNQRISIDEAVDQLENLAVAWRGDDTEIRTRAILGDLYIDRGLFREALTALQGAVIAQPEHELAEGISDAMQHVFTSLFLDGEADSLPAIEALSLFYDFRELTPIGRRGDELVRRLADRLVEIDLLDQAADLLEHQVENRLSGAARAQIAADLAIIYLMDYRPAEAVATLQRSRVTQIPMTIERGRRVIEARALSELGRHELALEMLRTLNGTDIDSVRADILWNAERWQEAAEVIERTLGERWLDEVPLSELEMQQILRASIGYSFSSDTFALERLRARFGPKMTDSVYASAFDVVSSADETHTGAFRDVVRGVAGLNTLNQFLSEYRSTFSAQAVPTGLSGA